jgi:hypothetical protein
MSTMKDRGYPRNFHLRDLQTRRVLVPMWKSDREVIDGVQPMARAQSLSEALHARYLLADRSVVSILDSSPKVAFRLNGKPRVTYPDFEVRYADGRVEIHEVKNVKRKGDREFTARSEAIALACKRLRKPYRVIFSDECYQEPRRHNVQLVIRSRNYPGAERFLPQARAFVASRHETTLGALMTAIQIDKLSFLALVCAGHFEIDLSRVINDDTIVKL